jgi:hypothetical protein
MIKTNFTPGPWLIADDYSNDVGGFIPILTNQEWDGMPWVAEAKGTNVSPAKNSEEVMANAKLVAAAPDMFEFIATLENDDKKIPAWLWKKRNEIIKKVTK